MGRKNAFSQYWEKVPDRSDEGKFNIHSLNEATWALTSYYINSTPVAKLLGMARVRRGLTQYYFKLCYEIFGQTRKSNDFI